MSVDSLSVWVIILACVFLSALLIQLIISLTVHLRPLLRYRAEAHQKVVFATEQPGVSIVIYAHNQADLLLRNLPILLELDYPNFEVIVVDDASSDETEDVLTMMEQRSDHFYHTKITDEVRTVSRRKLAVMLGVKAARYDIILQTQAQCVPASKQWIESMVRNFTPQTDVVLGPFCYEDRTSFMSRFYAYDLFDRMMTLFGLTIALRPYAGSNMNMAFRKQIFFDNRGFSKHLNLQPGEDDLFVADVSRRGNTRVECSAEALMISQETPLHYGWSKNRLNRAFTSRYYAFLPRLVKMIDSLTRYLTVLPALALLVLLWGNWWLFGIVAGLLLLRYVHLVLLCYFTSRRFGMHRFMFSTIAFELVLPLTDVHFSRKAFVNRANFVVAKI